MVNYKWFRFPESPNAMSWLHINLATEIGFIILLDPNLVYLPQKAVFLDLTYNELTTIPDDIAEQSLYELYSDPTQHNRRGFSTWPYSAIGIIGAGVITYLFLKKRKG